MRDRVQMRGLQTHSHVRRVLGSEEECSLGLLDGLTEAA